MAKLKKSLVDGIRPTAPIQYQGWTNSIECEQLLANIYNALHSSKKRSTDSIVGEGIEHFKVTITITELKS